MKGTVANPPIAIAGMHRSGTSMLTRALHDSGLHLVGSDADALISAAEDNPEGFWENKAIVACNDELLEITGGSWDNPPELPPQGRDDVRVASVVEAAEAALAGLRQHDHWGFKDPRVCLTAPFWLDLEPDLRFVICLRHPLEVALSLKRRNQNSYSLGLALWERYYASILATVPPERRIVSHYDSFFVAPDDELARVCEFAGLRPAPARVRRDLRHHTIDVSLTDAGVSPSLRALYADLCREAGVARPPDPPADEGRVSRLVLDGTVAAQYAEQRLTAIERLEERERQFRAEHSASEEAARLRIRDLENQLSDTRAAALRTLNRLEAIDARTRTMAKQLQVVHHEVSPGPIRKFARRSVRALARVPRRVAAEGPRPVARRAMQRLPDPAQQQLRRVQRGVAEPVRGGRALRSALTPRFEAAARTQAQSLLENLPAPAQVRMRATLRRVRRAQAAPLPALRRAVHGMPPPAQDAVRSAWRRTATSRRQGRQLLRSVTARPWTPAPVPKGPPIGQWRDRYRALVRGAIPDDAPWLVVAPGSPAEVRDAHPNKGTQFPDRTNRSTPSDDLALVSQLEAQRDAGSDFLVLPEGSRRWFRQHAELRDHVLSTYRCVTDDTGAGAVFDLREWAGPAGRSLRGEVQRLTAGTADSPAVLVWTDLDVGRDLPGTTTFRPPDGPDLPYIDASIEIVVRDEKRDAAEARRVATCGVVTIAAGPDGPELRSVEQFSAATSTIAPRVLVRTCPPNPDARWVQTVAERAAGAGADFEIGPIGANADDHEVVIGLEPFVIPLPGTIEALAALARAHPDRAFTGKVLGADGRIESAGGIVFSDRSVALVAEGSEAVRAAWHEYTRPVCWAPGILAASASLWATVPRPATTLDRTFVREWCAAIWAGGGSVTYEPTAAAVRTAGGGGGGEPTTPLETSAWQRVLDLRPRRPVQLGDGEWRYLLAHDDVGACRG